MRTKGAFLSTAVLLFVYTTGCANNETRNETRHNNMDSLPPVETKAPNSDYKPAFAGQTRIAGAKTSTPYTVEKISGKLGHPFAIVAMPDGRLMVTIKSGYMEIHDRDGALVKKITGFPPVVYASQGGLLDMTFDPKFATNGTIYWCYAEAYSGENLTAVAKGKLNEADGKVDDVQVIFRAAPGTGSTLQYGSRLVFDKEGYLFVSIGEKFMPSSRVEAQDLDSYLGKIIRITTDGKPAPGNPFLNKAGAKPEIYSCGHRNPEGLDIDPATGELWESEFGPRGGDEINIIRPGRNYGWPVITYGIEYQGGPVGEGIQQKAGMEQPVYYWDPVISPSGICFYRGNAIPEWKDNLFISCLSGEHLDRVIIKNNRVVGEERLLVDLHERIRDVAYMDQKLYAITDDGEIYRIAKR